MKLSYFESVRHNPYYGRRKIPLNIMEENMKMDQNEDKLILQLGKLAYKLVVGLELNQEENQ